MNFVLFHKGTPVPSHVSYCIHQLQKSNPTANIHFITDSDTPIEGANIVHLDTLSVPDIGSYYSNDPSGALFRNAMYRLFYIEAFMSRGITDVIHIDNDVLVYEDVATIQDKLKQFPFIMTEHNEADFVFGFSYIRDLAAIQPLTARLLDLVVQGEKVLEQRFGCMPHEMMLLKYINHDNLISSLPIMPTGEHYELFGCCFDPSTYGQILGGHSAENLQHHFIGDQVCKKNIEIKFANNKPIGYNNGVPYRIFNLHIHNKQLSQFI
jgi:hypothetical protein